MRAVVVAVLLFGGCVVENEGYAPTVFTIQAPTGVAVAVDANASDLVAPTDLRIDWDAADLHRPQCDAAPSTCTYGWDCCPGHDCACDQPRNGGCHNDGKCVSR